MDSMDPVESCHKRALRRSIISVSSSDGGVFALMFAQTVYLAVSSIPVISIIAFPIGLIVPPLRFQTWVYVEGGSCPWSQGPSKRLRLSVVLNNSLDEVTSISFTSGH